MERNLTAGLFHAVGLARHRRVGRRASPGAGVAGRINGDARPRMQVADNAVDLAAARGVLHRAALLIDEHHAANPASDGTAAELEALFAEAQAAKAFVNEAATRIVDRALALSGGAGYLNGEPAGARLPRRQGRARSCTRWAPTAPTTTSGGSRSGRRRRCTDMGAPARADSVQVPAANAFRDALARFATGVAFVTAAPGGEPAGLVVNSLASVSLDPPLISFCPSRGSLTWRRMRRAGRFGVNVLARHHEDFVARATPPAPIGSATWTGRRARRRAAADRRPGHARVRDRRRAPRRRPHDRRRPGGAAARSRPADDPLVFYRGAFRAVR